MEYGQPRRSATSDANEGRINPPARRPTARQVSVNPNKQQVSESDILLEEVGSALGNALANRVKTERANTKQQKMNAVAARQGQQTAINDIDADMKRTGWNEAIFGQNADYREAQQRAATNKVRELYIEQAATIEEHAGESPVEYSERLSKGLDAALAPYAGDQETQDLITTNWLGLTGKLSESHYKSHFAYNQEQQRATYEKQVQLRFDTYTVDDVQALSATNAEEKLDNVMGFFSGDDKPSGMSDVAWRGSVNNQIELALRNGNIGAYQMAEVGGWLKGLSPQEKTSMDEALSAYDTDYSQHLQKVYEESTLAAVDANNLTEAVAIWQQLRDRLSSEATRSTRSPKAMEAITKSNFNTTMGNLESSGRYDAENRLGYIGKYQFGGMALADTGYKDASGNWTGKDGVHSADDWKLNKEAQESAMVKLTNNNRRHLSKNGAFDLVGKQYGGVTVTKQGLLAASHLVGAQGVLDMISTGVVPKDANGTSALKYMSKFQDPEADVNNEVFEDMSLAQHSSGTPRSELKLARLRAAAAKSEAAVHKLSKATADKAGAAAVKAEAKAARLQALKDAHRDTNANSRSAVLSELSPSREEEASSLDATIVEDVQGWLGLDKAMTMTEASKAILSDVKVARKVANRIKGKQVDSPMVTRAIETVLGGFHAMTDENGMMNEDAIKSMESIAQFEKDESNFKGMIGSKNYDHYEIVKRGMYLGHTADMISKDLDLFDKNTGKAGTYAIDWDLDKENHESKRDRIQSLIERYTGQTPTGASLAHFQEEYARGLTLYKGDRKLAENYLRTSSQNAGLMYDNRVIYGGKSLNDVTDYTFETLMNEAQKPVGEASMLTGKLAEIMGSSIRDENGVPLTSTKQVPNLEFYTIDGVAGVYMTAVGAQRDAFISHSDMKVWANKTTERNKLRELEEENAGKAQLKYWQLQNEARVRAGKF